MAANGAQHIASAEFYKVKKKKKKTQNLLQRELCIFSAENLGLTE